MYAGYSSGEEWEPQEEDDDEEYYKPSRQQQRRQQRLLKKSKLVFEDFADFSDEEEDHDDDHNDDDDDDGDLEEVEDDEFKWEEGKEVIETCKWIYYLDVPKFGFLIGKWGSCVRHEGGIAIRCRNPDWKDPPKILPVEVKVNDADTVFAHANTDTAPATTTNTNPVTATTTNTNPVTATTTNTNPVTATTTNTNTVTDTTTNTNTVPATSTNTNTVPATTTNTNTVNDTDTVTDADADDVGVGDCGGEGEEEEEAAAAEPPKSLHPVVHRFVRGLKESLGGRWAGQNSFFRVEKKRKVRSEFIEVLHWIYGRGSRRPPLRAEFRPPPDPPEPPEPPNSVVKIEDLKIEDLVKSEDFESLKIEELKEEDWKCEVKEWRSEFCNVLSEMKVGGVEEWSRWKWGCELSELSELRFFWRWLEWWWWLFWSGCVVVLECVLELERWGVEWLSRRRKRKDGAADAFSQKGGNSSVMASVVVGEKVRDCGRRMVEDEEVVKEVSGCSMVSYSDRFMLIQFHL